MRVPLSWLRDYVDVDLSPGRLAEELTMRGMEVSAIEVAGADWTGVVVGPGSDDVVIRSVQVVSLTPAVGLLVVVLARRFGRAGGHHRLQLLEPLTLVGCRAWPVTGIDLGLLHPATQGVAVDPQLLTHPGTGPGDAELEQRSRPDLPDPLR